MSAPASPALELVPLMCAECDGDGGWTYASCRMPHHQGQCPCAGGEWSRCPTCDGTGHAECDYCTEGPAMRRTEDGDQVCTRCYRAVASAEVAGRDRPARAGGR